MTKPALSPSNRNQCDINDFKGHVLDFLEGLNEKTAGNIVYKDYFEGNSNLELTNQNSNALILINDGSSDIKIKVSNISTGFSSKEITIKAGEFPSLLFPTFTNVSIINTGSSNFRLTLFGEV